MLYNIYVHTLNYHNHHYFIISMFKKQQRSVTDYLTGEKLEALYETRDRIDWLLKEEIMHGLLNSQPVDKSVLMFIHNQLKSKNTFVDFPTSFAVPLSFVKRKQGQERFLKEFIK